MNMNHLLDLNNAEPNDIPSLGWLRITHSNLLQLRREQGETPQLLDKLEIFIKQAVKIGAVLHPDDEERRTDQHVLDYWADILYRAGRTAPDATLVDFDPKCVPQLPDELCPYQGLNAFQPEHYRLFYGRQRLIDFLVGKIKEGHRLLAVVGPSGSGKSSLVLAGLWPTLKTGALPGSQDWRYYTMMPGSDPLESLVRLLQPPDVNAVEQIQQQIEHFRQNAGELVQLVHKQSDQPIVLIVDQFEEIFTLCNDDANRQAFVDNLVGLMQTPEVMHKVILTMRTDFETHITRLPTFQPLFEQARVQVTPLSAGELRDVIEKPAAQVGLKFETGVVDALLKDIMSEPAALPLLQFTLLKLWEKRERNRITWQAYERIGGGRWALAKSADEFYGNLIPEEQVTVRHIFLQMVQPVDGLEVTSNRIWREKLYKTGEASDRIDRVLNKLVQARLVRLTEGSIPASDQIEVAHEALIRNWPRLVDWLDEERANMHRRLRLRTAADDWVRLAKDESALWSGLQLEGALHFEDFSDLEQEFIQASIELRDRQTQEKEDQRAAQLKLQYTQALAKEQQKRADDQALANKRLRRIQKLLVAVMAVVLLLAIAAAGLGQRAQQQADIAATAEIRAQDEAKQAKLNLSKFWAEEAKIDVTERPQGSLLLAAEAVALSTQLQGEPISRTVQALRSILAKTGGEPLQSSDNHVITDATLLMISPDQHWLAAGSRDGAIYLWDLTANKPLTAVTTLHPHTAAVTTMAFSPDGHWLATGSKDHTVQLTYRTATGFAASVTLTGHSDDVTTLAFKPTNILTDGSAWLATGSADGTVQLFALDGQDSATGLTAFKTLSENAGLSKVVFSPDGQWLATVGVSNTLKLWKVDPNNPAMDSPMLRREEAGLIAFSPKGKWLVAASNTYTNVQLYAMVNPDGQFLGGQLPGQGQGVYALAFDATEQWLAVGSDDGSVQVWDLDAVVSQLQLPKRLPTASPTKELPPVLSYPVLTKTVSRLLSSHEGVISALAFAPTGDWLATSGVDHSFQLWRMADLVAEPRPWLKFYSSDRAIEAILWGERKDLLDDQEKQVFAYTYNGDGSIRFWKPLAPPPTLMDLTTEELIALACARAGRDFSVQEKQQHFDNGQYVSTCSQINMQPR